MTRLIVLIFLLVVSLAALWLSEPYYPGRDSIVSAGPEKIGQQVKAGDETNLLDLSDDDELDSELDSVPAQDNSFIETRSNLSSEAASSSGQSVDQGSESDLANNAESVRFENDFIGALSEELGSTLEEPVSGQVQVEPGLEEQSQLSEARGPPQFYPGVGRQSENRRVEPTDDQEELLDPLLDEDIPQPEVLPRLAGQARGYTMLYLMQPEARQTVERQVQAMLDAEVQDLYLGVLVDGTFSKDFDYFRSVLSRLSADGRQLTLVVYLSNGPTMRRFDRTPIEAGFNQIDPIEFRDLIREDPAVRARFVQMVEEAQPIFQYNKSLNSRNTNIAVVMLEDNLDSTSYLAMRQLAGSVLGDSVIYMRNPCPGCYAGNDLYSYGDRIELHAPEGLHALSVGDGFTLDGESYHFPGEATGGGLSLDEVEFFKGMSMDQGLRYFGLWRTQRQGLHDGQSVHPRDRHYEVPSDAQIEKEIELLRSGLVSID